MTTNIYHYRNSSIEICNKNLRLLMDPWINSANLGSWAGCNAKKFFNKKTKIQTIDFIYISHLHSDHFDIKLLKYLKKKKKKKFKIIIKKFRDNRLKKKILSYNFLKKKDIIELENYEIYELKRDNYFCILPQLSASVTINKLINYDLDTSCIFFNKDVKLYNQVDNPYSPLDLKKIISHLKKIGIKNDYDMSFIPYCAASEYPQGYINLNRKSEKNKIIDKCLKIFYDTSKNIKTKYLVPAGGTYKLDLIYSKLNSYLAVPNNKQVIKKYKLFDKNNKINILDGEKYFFEFNNRKMKLKKSYYKDYFKSYINKNGKDPLDNMIKNKFNSKKIKNKLELLEKNFGSKKLEIYTKLKTSISLEIYDKQPLKISQLKSYKKKVSHTIFNNEKKKIITLKVHMSFKVLYLLINSIISWNELQALCLFERKPNIYEPDANFWLNLYKL